MHAIQAGGRDTNVYLCTSSGEDGQLHRLIVANKHRVPQGEALGYLPPTQANC